MQQFKNLPISEIYRNLYPWRNIGEFINVIRGAIAYKADDNSLIAINKPFGVGTYVAIDNNSSKQNQDKILSRLHGSPKYCLKDVLKPLSDEFSPNKPYEILKTIDRYMSGLVLITNDLKTLKPRFEKALTNGRINKQPSFGLRAITSGYPLLNQNKLYERVGMKLIEVDEFGDYKEPIIVKNPPQKYDDKFSRDMASFQVQLEVQKVNKTISAALVELYVSKLQWDFARCYLSSKTSFILGDVRFSKRIREILGKPIQVSAFKSSHRYDDNYEPLNSKLRNLLGVYKNASIPLMLDLHAIRLKGFYDRKHENRDLLIKSSYMPLHFASTAQKLKLLDNDYYDNNDLSCMSNNDGINHDINKIHTII